MALNHFLGEIQKYGIEHPMDINSVIQIQTLVKNRSNAFLRSSIEGGLVDGTLFPG